MVKRAFIKIEFVGRDQLLWKCSFGDELLSCSLSVLFLPLSLPPFLPLFFVLLCLDRVKVLLFLIHIQIISFNCFTFELRHF